MSELPHLSALRREMLAVEAEQEKRSEMGAALHPSVGAVMATLLGFEPSEEFDVFLGREMQRTFAMLTAGWYAQHLTPEQRVNPGALIGLGMTQGITLAVAARRLRERRNGS